MSVTAGSLSPKGSSDNLFTTSKGQFDSPAIAAAVAAETTATVAAVGSGGGGSGGGSGCAEHVVH